MQRALMVNVENKKNKQKGKMMEWDFVVASFVNLAVNLSYTILALFVAVIALVVIDKKLLKGVDIQQELKANNLAVAIFASAILIFVALIICFGMKA